MFFPSKRHQYLFFLLVAWTAFVAMLIVIRFSATITYDLIPNSYQEIKETRGRTYAFLLWNLVLAWVPYLISLWATNLSQKSVNQWFVLTVGLVWLVFLPNAPYIVTDLLHLSSKPTVPLWFDVILLFSAAWTGLLLGLLSVRQMHKIIAAKVKNKRVEHTIILAILALTGYGVWLGRFHRWNTWDIVTRPHHLIVDIFRSLTHAPVAQHAWATTGILFVFLSLGYYSLYLMVDKPGLKT
jgi:uncharacterized membrane protein